MLGTTVPGFAFYCWLDRTKALIERDVLSLSGRKMNGNDEKIAIPSSSPVDKDTLNFLALLCDELGDKEAIVRAYRRWSEGERMERFYETPRPKEHEGRSFASEMYRKEKERREKEHGPWTATWRASTGRE
jgi:hypothetical protein